MTFSKRHFGFSVFLCFAFCAGIQAQTSTTAPQAEAPPAPSGTPEPSSTGSGTQVLESVVVTGVRLEDQVSPLQRPVSSVLGFEVSVLDTPRAVTEINSAQVRDESIVDVTDFAKVTSNAYTNYQFGGPNVPFLRGQQAEVFQNGMLRTPRADGQPLSFNSVEGFDVIKGPADVAFGPTGNVGGYVNLVTKRPFFDDKHNTLSLTYGEYDTKKGQLDVSGRLTSNMAYRVSYEGIFEKSYYRYGFQRSNDIYAAVRYLPTDSLTVDFNTEYYKGHYTENTGINRPTQELIDHGLYYQGTGVSAFYSGSGDPRGFDSIINVTGVVPINRSYQLVAPSDHDQGSNYQAQLDITELLTDTWTLENKAYFEDYSQLQIEYAQRYYNNIAQSYNFEDRVELRNVKTNNQFETGLSYRFIHVLAYGDFFNEYLNATDITTNPSNFPITTNLYGVVHVPGANSTSFATPGAFYNTPNYEDQIANTQEQSSNQVGLYIQDMYNITSKLTALGGARADVIHESLTDPLPPPGYAAFHAGATHGEQALNTSLTYKPATWGTLYLTADYNSSPVTTNGGGFAAFTGDGIRADDFHVRNFLYEAGSKFALLDKKLFLSDAVFLQKRAQTDEFGNTTKVNAFGYELEADYQPDRHFSASAAYGYLNASLPNASGSLAFTQNVYDAFAAPYGTGVGSPNFNPLPAGNYRVPSVPRQLFSNFLKYRATMGLGASVGMVVTGPINTSYIGNVKIPAQYTLDSGLFYETRRWSARVNFYNITNQKNWIAEGGPEGNDLITAALPFHVMGTVSAQF